MSNILQLVKKEPASPEYLVNMLREALALAIAGKYSSAFVCMVAADGQGDDYSKLVAVMDPHELMHLHMMADDIRDDVDGLLG